MPAPQKSGTVTALSYNSAEFCFVLFACSFLIQFWQKEGDNVQQTIPNTYGSPQHLNSLLPQLEIQAEPRRLQNNSKLVWRLRVKAEEERRATLTIRLLLTNDQPDRISQTTNSCPANGHHDASLCPSLFVLVQADLVPTYCDPFCRLWKTLQSLSFPKIFIKDLSKC